MTISDFKHIYFGSLYCGPVEAYLRLKNKNLLLPRDVRKVSIRNKIAARRIDLTWRINVQTFSDGTLPTFAQISTNEKLNKDDPLAGFNTVFNNTMLGDIYSIIGAHALLASANNRKVSEDDNIRKLLNIAELIVDKTLGVELRDMQKQRQDRIRESIEACRSFGFYCILSRMYGKDADGSKALWEITSVWTDEVDDLIFTLTTEEQRHVYSILKLSDESVARKYLKKASNLTHQPPEELMETGFIDSLVQFVDFVRKGEEFGFFDGWKDSTNSPSRRDVWLNDKNPIIAKIISEEKSVTEGASPESNENSPQTDSPKDLDSESVILKVGPVPDALAAKDTAAEQFAQAMAKLQMARDGDLDVSITEVFEQISTSANMGHPPAIRYLQEMNQRSAERDSPDYIQNLIESGEEGDVQACISLALAYSGAGLPTELEKSPEKERYWWLKAADLGSSEAQFMAGMILDLEGLTEEGEAYLRKSANSGNEAAINYLKDSDRA